MRTPLVTALVLSQLTGCAVATIEPPAPDAEFSVWTPYREFVNLPLDCLVSIGAWVKGQNLLLVCDPEHESQASPFLAMAPPAQCGPDTDDSEVIAEFVWDQYRVRDKRTVAGFYRILLAEDHCVHISAYSLEIVEALSAAVVTGPRTPN